MRKFLAGVFFTILVLAAGWYAYQYVMPVPIGKIVENPAAFEGKVLTISGKVDDSVSLLFLKYYKLKDKTGAIIVIPAGESVPSKGAGARVRGSVAEAFKVGDKRLLVFIEEGADGGKQSR